MTSRFPYCRASFVRQWLHDHASVYGVSVGFTIFMFFYVKASSDFRSILVLAFFAAARFDNGYMFLRQSRSSLDIISTSPVYLALNPGCLRRLRSAAGKYHSPGNKFERFRRFLELISRFEFEFCRPGEYFF